MTREESIKRIQDFIGWFKEDSNTYKALDMAIKALEHPEQNVIAVVPCGDCISRQAVLKLKHHKPEYGDMIYAFDVKQLPSVTQKSGKWIEKEGWDGDVYYECSVCGEPFCLIDGTPTDNMYNYCPNCGAKMESEDKE